MDSVSAHQKGMPMASHHQNQLVARCIVALADSERFADNHLVAAACSAEALAVAADSAALLVAVGPTRYSAPFLDN